jgi:ABC-type dipeptide/oligopeptide/nickel transport system permease component
LIPFLLRRLGSSLASVLGVSILVFLLVHLIPGDPVDNMLGEAADPRDKAALRACLDLDRPLPSQLGRYFRHVADGTLGSTCHDPLHPRTVASLIGEVLPSTMALAAAALLLAILLALPLGTAAALKRGTVVDGAATLVSLAGYSIHTTWLGPILIMIFYISLRWLPGPADDAPGIAGLVLPAVTLGTHLMAMLSRMTRSSLLEVVGEDYVRTARAKGLGESAVIVKHALRNALVPVITVAGIQFGSLLAGAVVVEKVFARPGIGTLLLDAILQRDYRVVQGCTLVIALSYVIVNLLVDLAYGLADPRIRLR